MSGSRSPARRVLVLTPFPLRFDARHGGSRAMAATVDALSRRHRVGVLSLRGPDEPPTDPVLSTSCEWIDEVGRRQDGAGLTGSLRRRAREGRAGLSGTPAWASLLRSDAYERRLRERVDAFRPDVVQFENHVMGQYARAVHARGPVRILVLHEPGAAAALDRRRSASGLRAVLRQSDLLAWRRWEPRIVRGMDAVVTFTERDREQVRAVARDALVRVVPLAIPVPDQPLDALGEAPPSLLFVGSFTHPPNVEAALVLVREVLPAVRTEVPSARAIVVGPHPPAALAGCGVDGAVITGAVPDVTPYLNRATTVVAPIWSGGGMRIKVLEALAAGKALVATPRAIEGLELVPGREVLVGEDPAALARAVIDLVRDPQRRSAVAGAGRSWAEANLGREAAAVRYERVWDEALTARARGGLSAPRGSRSPGR